MPWNRSVLQNMVKEKLNSTLFVVVSNREPYQHVYIEDEIKCISPVSGLIMALDPVMKACGGLWVAHGNGEADQEVVDKDDCVLVPPDNPKYKLKRVWLTKEEEDGYYYGFSNEGMWPLCHTAYTRPEFNVSDWEMYKKVNKKFADAIYKEVGKKQAIIFIQDYHFSLLPKYIKERCPHAVVAQFWHIPWPYSEAFRICPWKQEILEGLLGNDLLGFHIRYHCQNFIYTVDNTLESRIDKEGSKIIVNGKATLVKAFPISVDFAQISEEAGTGKVKNEIAAIRKRYNIRSEYIGIGLDRFDYTKGIPERLKAIDRFLEKHPEYIRRFTFVQLGMISRIHIEKYRKLNEEIESLVEDINWKYQQGAWQPIIMLRERWDDYRIRALCLMAHFCIVSSLHDGMNLVAKEYVASRADEDGVLILSQFTGASRELNDALIINPFAIDATAHCIYQAITMDKEERQKRMQRLRSTVRLNNIYRWAGKIISELIKINSRVAETLP